MGCEWNAEQERKYQRAALEAEFRAAAVRLSKRVLQRHNEPQAVRDTEILAQDVQHMGEQLNELDARRKEMGDGDTDNSSHS